MLLALVAGIVSAAVGQATWTVLLVLVYVAVVFAVVRPLLRHVLARLHDPRGPLRHTTLAVVFSALLLSAVATETIGIHALFGGFLLGAVMPRERGLPEAIRARLEAVVMVLLLPAFFAFTGMRTSVGLLGSGQDWLVFGLVLAVATVGKFGGTLVAARLAGHAWRPAAALGILMNTRGLMELIVLNLGLDLGVITPTVFTMLVLMALVTTFATTPLLDLVLGRAGFADAPAPAAAPRGRA